MEKGAFYSPDVEKCIANSEIHFVNPNKDGRCEEPTFYSLNEQWLKYGSLILHPGLITPSPEERCMVVAFTAKYNSGCISRQVGAVITNEFHSIRTIGWNDVPYGQIPCALRNISELTNPVENTRKIDGVYSQFEKSASTQFNGESFINVVSSDYDKIKETSPSIEGLPYSYCFKSFVNKYGDNKNQVYTRSLHAEENAMLQLVRYGGESLKNGIIYVTASPCDLCCKKLYQIGVRKIVYIDPYPGFAIDNIIANGFKRPELKLFQGATGATYHKLYQSFMAYKDEFL